MRALSPSITLQLLAVGLVWTLPVQDTYAATAQTVQSGTVANAANGIQTVTISGVDPTRSFLIFETRHNSNRPVGSEVRGRIPIACGNPCTTIEFERVTDEGVPATINIQWYVVSFVSGVWVQRGEVAQDALVKNVTIPQTLSAVSQAFVLWSKTPTNTDTTWDGNDYVLGEITSTTNLQFRTDGATAAHMISWQIVEFTDPADINVQKGSLAMTTAQTSVTATLGTAVDVNKTFVLVGLRTAASGAANIGALMLRAELTDSTTVTVDRSTVGAPALAITEIVWQAIELRDKSSVWSGSSNFAAGVAQTTTSLVPQVNVPRAIAFGSVQSGGGQNMGRSPYVGDDILGVGCATMVLSATQLTLDRNNTAAAADVSWFVVEFDQGEAKVLSGSYLGDGTDGRTIDVGFVPDFVIVKGNLTEFGVFRTSTMTGDNAKDGIGATALSANLIESIVTAGDGGFTIGSDPQVNSNGVMYYWTAFRAGPGKMQVGSYTGTGAASPPPITGLGFSPELVYIMSAGAHEAIHRSSMGGTFDFNESGDLSSVTTLDADGFTVANQPRANAAGTIYHYVAWNEGAGYLDVGTYTGNGAASQDITTVGFEPEYLVVKKNEQFFFAHHRPASVAQSSVDATLVFYNFGIAGNRMIALLSNGFRVGSQTNVNEAGDTYLYYAWKRESQPFIITGDYDGNGGAQAITGLGFTPDVVIIKSSAANTAQIRTSTMVGDLTKPMVTATALSATRIQSLDAGGFTLGNHVTVNSNLVLYYFIAFKAAPGTMKVGTYTGDATAPLPRAITGVGFSPELVFIMSAGANEAVHRSSASAETYNFANSGGNLTWISSLDADGFSLNSIDGRVNATGVTYHYIAWNEIPGQMDVGSYVGGVPLDNKDITGVGFEPEYVIVKQIDGQLAVHHPGSLGRSVDSSLFFNATANTNNLIQALQPDGFQVGGAIQVNANATYVYYAWKRPYVSALTAVRLTSFTATRYDRGVLAEWRTGYEIDNLGFHLYREVDGHRTRVTRSLVAGSGLMAGQGRGVTSEQRYAFWDLESASAAPSAVYWLEDVDFNGARTWHGPIRPVPGGLQAPPDVAPSEALHERFGARKGSKPRGRTFLLAGPRASEVRTEGPLAAPASAGTQWALAAGPAVKIAIDRPGWYRVTQPELLAAGLDSAVDPRRLQLFIEGAEQAMTVTGEADGRFDAADTVEFYGTGTDTPYTDTRVYWLAAGTTHGRRISMPVKGRPGRSLEAITAGSFPFTLQHKERSTYFAALRNGDEENWFGSLVSEDPTEMTLTVSNVDAAGAAELEVTLQGVTSEPDLHPDHQVAVFVNDVEVGELLFDGQTKGIQAFTIPAGLLHEGANTVQVLARGGEANISLVDVVRLRYSHTYHADADLLRFTVDGPASVTVGGFASSPVRVVDITDPLAAEELRTTSGQDAGQWTATIHVTAGGPRTLLAFTNATIATPASVRANGPSRWHAVNHAADYVAISHAAHIDWVAPLTERRAQQGHATVRIDVEDLYDEFSFGEKRPQALKDFLARARASWRRAPRFLLLVGDATIDPRDYAGFGDADFVPTKQIALGHVALETASDDWFADMDDDGMPEMAIGRLSVRTTAQAERMVAKILEYDNGAGAPWTGNVLLVADENGPTDDFERSSGALSTLVPPGYGVQQVFSGLSGPDAARAALIDAVNQGQLIVNYIGHGSVSVWGSTGTLLTAADVTTAWHNSTRLPLVVAMNCLNGFFHGIYDEESLAETLLRAPNGGAVAAWASSGITESATQARVNQELFRLLFAQPGTPVGEAVVAAKLAVRDPDLRRSWIFFGDPALRLHRLAPPAQSESIAAQSTDAPAGNAESSGDSAADEPSSPAHKKSVDPVRLADFDADGRADVLLYDAETGRWSLSMSDPDGPRVTEGVWLARAQAFAGRFDGDRRGDVFLYAPASGDWMQALGNGDGTFRIDSGVWAAGWDVRVANFVGDARDEVLVYQPITGDWCMSDTRRRFAFRSCGVFTAGDLSVADYNRDSLADLFVAGRAGNGRVALSDGFGGFSFDRDEWPAPPALTVAAGDLSGDGVDDLLLYDPLTGSWSAMADTASGLLPLADGVWSPELTIASGDLDGDGRTEILLYDASARQWTRCGSVEPGLLTCSAGGAWDPASTVVGKR